MSNTTVLTKNARTIVTAGTSNAAAGTTRGTVDLQTAQGGFLTIKVTNGPTGPTIPATANVLIAHNATIPSAAAAGANWKTVASFISATGNNVITEFYFDVSPGIMCLEVEFTGNTAQAVVVEAYFSEITNASTS